MQLGRYSVCCLVLLGSFIAPSVRAAAEKQVSAAVSGGQVHQEAEAPEGYPATPLSFEVNAGQLDSVVKFVARGHGYKAFFAPNEAVFSLREAADATRVIRMKLTGGQPSPKVRGLDVLPGKVNYFAGSDPKSWRAGIATCARVACRDVHPGIDLVYRGASATLYLATVLESL